MNKYARFKLFEVLAHLKAEHGFDDNSQVITHKDRYSLTQMQVWPTYGNGTLAECYEAWLKWEVNRVDEYQTRVFSYDVAGDYAVILMHDPIYSKGITVYMVSKAVP